MKITLRRLRKNENIRQFQDNVNALVAQNALIHVDVRQTFAQEKAWLDDLWKLTKRGAARVWVAEVNGNVSGVSEARRGYGREKDNVEVRVGVVPSQQGKGIGMQLMRKVIQDAKSWKAKTVWLSVLSKNNSAIALYQKLGFRTVARLPQWAEVSGQRVDKLIMVLAK